MTKGCTINKLLVKFNSTMKAIVLIALVCSSALAIQSKPTERKTNLVEIFKEKIAPQLTSLQAHKITRANLFNVLEEKDGLRRCVDQFIDSAEEIYNHVNRAAERFVPLFQNYNLNGIIIKELPQIVQKAGLRTYEDLVDFIEYVYGDLPAEETVIVFIGVGIYASTFEVPYYTAEALYNLINGISKEAGTEFDRILMDLSWDSIDSAIKFFRVLIVAIFELQG